MKNTVSFLDKTYDNDKLDNITAAIDTALNCRSLDVDTMQVELTTGPAELGLWSSEPLALFDSDGKRLFSSEDTSIGAWTRDDALILARGGSQYAIVYPESMTRVGAMEYLVSCTSALGKLAQMGHKGGIYDSVSQTKAGPLLREICGYVNGQPAAGVTIYVAPEYEDQHIYGWLPYLSPTGEAGAQTGSARDNLLQVLFAINGSLRDDANGVLRVETLSVEPSASLTADRIYRNNAQVIEEQPITEVTVLEHAYVVGSETKTLFEGTTSAGQVIVFSGPMANLSASGFTITESGANYAVLSAGSGTLTGTPYVDTTREITRTVSEAAVPNTERVEKATLVSIVNSSSVADRLAAYYACRKWIECDAVIEYEDAGDVVNIWDPFDKVMRQACIEKISPLKVSNVMQGRVSALIGFAPWQTEVFDDEYELLTGSGTWSVPEGVSEVTAVLIGKGADGAAGAAGGGSGGLTTKSQTARQTYTEGTKYSLSTSASTSGSSSSGKGGAGGAGGEGGKILRVSIDVSELSTISFSCGATAASPETTFGEYSSENGASSPGGYYDVVSGVTFGRKGADGEAGGNGGSGGSAGGSTTGASGGSGAASVSYEIYTQETGLYARSVTSRISGAGAGGGGAGGASGTNHGSNGNNAYSAYARASAGEYFYGGIAYGDCAHGGSGGNGANGANATAYGCGGGGGGGGGGAGANGSVSTTGTLSGTAKDTIEHRITAYAYGTGAKSGGTGGTGGTGMQGCVILIYRKPAEE